MSSFDKAVTEGKRSFDLGDILEDFFGVGHPLTHIAARVREENPEGPTLDMNGRPRIDDNQGTRKTER